MAHILTLKNTGQTPRPDIGPFKWSNEHKRYLWKGKVLTTADELAQAVNEAVPFLKQYDNPYIDLVVEQVADADQSHEPRKKLVLAKT